MLSFSYQNRIIKGVMYTLFFLYLHLQQVKATPGLVLPEERTTGLGCIPEGRNVSYQCTVNDASDPLVGSTIWSGSAFECPGTSNQISLTHSLFESGQATATCGSLRAIAVGVNGDNYVSQLSLTASTELNGATLSCTLSGLTEIGSDVITIGAIPPPPETSSISLESSFTVNWSPPSDPVEGGVGGYMFGVTGEGCGCVNVNVSSDTTSVTCSGWTAAGQTCSFEVRTLSQDCGFGSSPTRREVQLIACDPVELGDNLTSTNVSPGKITFSSGEILYNGVLVGSTAYLKCNDGYAPEVDSSNRTCMDDGNWSGTVQTCISIQICMAAGNLGLIIALVLAIILGAIIFVVSVIYFCWNKYGKSGAVSIPHYQDHQISSHSRSRHHIYDDVTDIALPTFHKREDITLVFKQDDEPAKFENKIDGQASECRIARPIDAVVHDNFAYFRHLRTRLIYIYNSNTNKWLALPKCRTQDTSLAILPIDEDKTDFRIHTVGGFSTKTKIVVGDLFYFKYPSSEITKDTKDLDEEDCWEKSTIFSPLGEVRKQVTVICDKEYNYLIAAGGRGRSGPSKAVEVLDLRKKGSNKKYNWSKAANLPKAVFAATSCIKEDFLYILGGFTFNEYGDKKSVKLGWKTLWTELVDESSSKKAGFHDIAEIPLPHSTYLTFCDRLFAIGGSEYNREAQEAVPTTSVYEYNPEDNLWEQVNHSLHKRRSFCFAVSLNTAPKQLMVMGGYISKPDEHCTASVEFGELNS